MPINTKDWVFFHVCVYVCMWCICKTWFFQNFLLIFFFLLIKMRKKTFFFHIRWYGLTHQKVMLLCVFVRETQPSYQRRVSKDMISVFKLALTRFLFSCYVCVWVCARYYYLSLLLCKIRWLIGIKIHTHAYVRNTLSCVCVCVFDCILN